MKQSNPHNTKYLVILCATLGALSGCNAGNSSTNKSNPILNASKSIKTSHRTSGEYFSDANQDNHIWGNITYSDRPITSRAYIHQFNHSNDSISKIGCTDAADVNTTKFTDLTGNYPTDEDGNQLPEDSVRDGNVIPQEMEM